MKDLIITPTKPAKARKLIRDGVAKKCWSKTGIFYIQMLRKVGEEIQDMAFAIDPGSKYDGYAVSTPTTKRLMVWGERCSAQSNGSNATEGT